MKISKRKLRRMIREEAKNLVKERYEARQIQPVIDDIRSSGIEELGRIKITGPTTETRWLSVSAQEVEQILRVFT